MIKKFENFKSESLLENKVSKDNFIEISDDLMVRVKDYCDVSEFNKKNQQVIRHFQITSDNLQILFEEIANLIEEAKKYNIVINPTTGYDNRNYFNIHPNNSYSFAISMQSPDIDDVDNLISRIVNDDNVRVNLKKLFDDNVNYYMYDDGSGWYLFSCERWNGEIEKLRKEIKYMNKTFATAEPEIQSFGEELSFEANGNEGPLLKYIYNLLKSNNLL